MEVTKKASDSRKSQDSGLDSEKGQDSVSGPDEPSLYPNVTLTYISDDKPDSKMLLGPNPQGKIVSDTHVTEIETFPRLDKRQVLKKNPQYETLHEIPLKSVHGLMITIVLSKVPHREGILLTAKGGGHFGVTRMDSKQLRLWSKRFTELAKIADKIEEKELRRRWKKWQN